MTISIQHRQTSTRDDISASSHDIFLACLAQNYSNSLFTSSIATDRGITCHVIELSRRYFCLPRRDSDITTNSRASTRLGATFSYYNKSRPLFRVGAHALSSFSRVRTTAAFTSSVSTMYRRRYRTTLGLGLGSSFSSSFSTTLSFRTSSTTSSTAADTVRSDARATAAKLKSKYENAGTAQGAFVTNVCATNNHPLVIFKNYKIFSCLFLAYI